MSKWKRKKKLWKVKKTLKGNFPKKKNNRIVNNNSSKIYIRESAKSFNIKDYNKNVPEVFSIVENTEETLCFFNDVVAEIKQKHYKEKFFFNFKNVKKVTIDALMYLLAIMQNIYSEDNVLNQSFSGNHADDSDVNECISESGFYDYVEITVPVTKTRGGKKIQISDGDNVDARLVKSICDFVNESCKTEKRFTQDLYEVLIEVMANTVQHAYSVDEIWEKHNWYIFIEDKEEYIQFTFLDIGEGIPKTINKKFHEKIKDIMIRNDADYIISALNGEFRSQTKLESRGNGLPTVKKYGERKEVEEMHIISGRGVCIFESNKELITKKIIKNRLDGTIFYWKIKKSDIGRNFIK